MSMKRQYDLDSPPHSRRPRYYFNMKDRDEFINDRLSPGPSMERFHHRLSPDYERGIRRASPGLERNLRRPLSDFPPDFRHLSPEYDRNSRHTSPEFDRRMRRYSPEIDHVRQQMKRREPLPFFGRDNFDLERDRTLKRFRDARDVLESPYVRPDHFERPFHEYKTLCITNLPEVSDLQIREILYKRYSRFPDFNVKVVEYNNNKIAFVNFRFPEDAIEARSLYDRLILYEKLVRVEPVYPKKRSDRNDSPPNRNRHFRNDSPQSDNRRGRSNYLRDFDYDLKRRRNAPPQDSDHHKGSGPKFPHHLQHVNPEDDSKATRTLFIGNLDLIVSEQELKELFQPFGCVEDVDIKKPLHGQGNAYAFMRFFHLEMAHKAKVEMSGKYIGRFQCKIGYGKLNPTNCVWVGGLGPWTDVEQVESEFDRFGAITKIVWPDEQTYCFVLFDSIDAATAACQEMRGYQLGGKEHRIKTDFADPNQMDNPIPPPPPSPKSSPPVSPRASPSVSRRARSSSLSDGELNSSHNNNSKTGEILDIESSISNELRRQRKSSENVSDTDKEKAPSVKLTTNDNLSSGEKSEGELDPDSSSETEAPTLNMKSVNTVDDLARRLPLVWRGAFVLKKNSFGACMYQVSGDPKLVSQLMTDDTDCPHLKITQRLRLDQPKLEEVGRRISSSGPGGHAVLLAMSLDSTESSSVLSQYRPLKNLVSYLRQKEAAGVITLPSTVSKDEQNKDAVGVLHAFPPCSYGHNILLPHSPNLILDVQKEDHLVVVVVRASRFLYHSQCILNIQQSYILFLSELHIHTIHQCYISFKISK